jgi:chromosome segregation ATPase
MSADPGYVINVIPKEKWSNPKTAKKCSACTKELGMFETKANCYCCGIVCCLSCVAEKVAMPPTYPDPQPCCLSCRKKVNLKKNFAGNKGDVSPRTPRQTTESNAPGSPTATTGAATTAKSASPATAESTPKPAAVAGAVATGSASGVQVIDTQKLQAQFRQMVTKSEQVKAQSEALAAQLQAKEREFTEELAKREKALQAATVKQNELTSRCSELEVLLASTKQAQSDAEASLLRSQQSGGSRQSEIEAQLAELRESFQKRVSGFESQQKEVTDEKQKLSAEFYRLSEEKAAFEAERQRWTAASAKLRQDQEAANLELRNSEESLQQKLSEHEQQVAALKSKQDSIGLEEKRLDELRQQLLRERERLEEEHKTLATREAALLKDQQSMVTKIQELEQARGASGPGSSTGVSAAEAEAVRQLERSLSDKAASLEGLQQHLAGEQQRLDAELRKAEENRAQMDSQLQQREAALNLRAEAMEAKMKELRALENEFSTQKLDLVAKENEISDRQATLEADRAANEMSLRNRSEELVKQREILSETESKLKVLEADLERQRKDLEAAKNAADQSRSDVERRSKQLDEETAKINAERATLAASRSSLELERSQLQEQTTAFHRLSQEKEEKAAEASSQLGEVEKAKKAFKEWKSEQARELQQAEAALAQRSAALEEREKAFAQQEAVLAAAQQQLQTDRATYETNHNQLTTEALELSEARDEHEAQVAELEQQRKKLTELEVSLKNDQEKLTNERIEVEASKAELKAQQAQLQIDQQQIEAARQLLSSEKAQLMEERAALEAARASVVQHEAQLRERMSTTQATIDQELTSRRTSLDQEAETLAKDRETVKQSLAEVSEQKRTLEQKLGAVAAEMESLSKEKALVSEQRTKLSEKESQLSLSMKELSEQKLAVESERKSLAKQKSEFEANNKQLQADREHLSGEEIRLSQEHADIALQRESLEKQKVELKRLASEVERSKAIVSETLQIGKEAIKGDTESIMNQKASVAEQYELVRRFLGHPASQRGGTSAVAGVAGSSKRWKVIGRVAPVDPQSLQGIATIVPEPVGVDVAKWTLDVRNIKVQPSNLLQAVAWAAATQWALVDTVVPTDSWLKLLAAIEAGYQPVPYHNNQHAAQVLQSSFAIANMCPALLEHMTPIEKVALLVAAAAHDYQHPGLNNGFLVNTFDPLAVNCNRVGVLENHHASALFKLMAHRDLDITEYLTDDEARTFHKLVTSIILRTDMDRHSEFGKVAYSTLKMDNPAHRLEALALIVHVADLGTFAKPLETMQYWNQQIAKEFMFQFQEEQRLRIPSSLPPGAGSGPGPVVPFMDAVIMPLFSLLEQLFGTQVAEPMLLLRQNHATMCRLEGKPIPTSTPPLQVANEPKNAEVPVATKAELDALRKQVEHLTLEKRGLEQQLTTLQSAASSRASSPSASSSAGKEAIIAELHAREESLRKQLQRLIDIQISEMSGVPEPQKSTSTPAPDASKAAEEVRVREEVVKAREERCREKEAQLAHYESLLAKRSNEVEAAESRLDSLKERFMGMDVEAKALQEKEDRLRKLEISVMSKLASSTHTESRIQIAHEMETRAALLYAEAEQRLVNGTRFLLSAQRVQQEMESKGAKMQELLERENAVRSAIEASKERRRKVVNGWTHQRDDANSKAIGDLEKSLFSLTHALAVFAE